MRGYFPKKCEALSSIPITTKTKTGQQPKYMSFVDNKIENKHKEKYKLIKMKNK
jgi:hypothetical protein